MERIKLDMGRREYRLGAGVLRFNPGDPNIYDRFRQMPGKMDELRKKFAETPDVDPVTKMVEADLVLKDLLNWIFGPGNDFEKMLEGINLLSVTSSGKTVLIELLEALEPIMISGAEECSTAISDQAVKKARQRRGEV